MKVFEDHNVLIFDDDIFMAKILETMLKSFNVGSVTVVHTFTNAMATIHLRQPHFIFLEWSGWDKPNLDFLDHIRKSGDVGDPMVPIVMVTGYTDLKHVLKARDAGANEIVAKPISPNHVYQKMYNALYKPREFITDDGFTGPDRRRKVFNYKGFDRRSEQALSQNQIDEMMK